METEYDDLDLVEVMFAIEKASAMCHALACARGWWHDLETGEKKQRNKGELLALIHSEISEALEGARKGKMDEHLPERTSEEVELADTLIRIFDYAGGFNLNLGPAFLEKFEYNCKREDHSIEARKAEGGKKF